MPRMIKKSAWKRHKLTDKKILWQTQNICNKHRGTVTKTDCLGKTQTVCDRHIMSVTDIFFLWPTKIFCDRQHIYIDCLWQKKSLSVADTHCLRQTHTKFDIGPSQWKWLNNINWLWIHQSSIIQREVESRIFLFFLNFAKVTSVEGLNQPALRKGCFRSLGGWVWWRSLTGGHRKEQLQDQGAAGRTCQ